MFSIGSSSSISFATVTPSLVTCGAPNFFSITHYVLLVRVLLLLHWPGYQRPFSFYCVLQYRRIYCFAILYYPYLQVRYETCGVEQDFNLVIKLLQQLKRAQCSWGMDDLNNCQNIAFSHNQVVITFNRNFGSGIFTI